MFRIGNQIYIWWDKLIKKEEPKRVIGTSLYTLRTPLIHDGDNLRAIILQTVKDLIKWEGVKINDRAILCIKESVLARSQGNYATTEQIVADIRSKVSGDHLGIVLPILSRNRFAEILNSISQAYNKVTVQLSYPADEVGNSLMSKEAWNAGLEKYKKCMRKSLDLNSDGMPEETFRNIFGEKLEHPITYEDYPQLYKSLNNNIEVVFGNNPLYILQYTKRVLAADIHSRFETKQLLINGRAHTVLGLDDIMNAPVNGSGYNEEYGLLGSNLSTPGRLKLFPRDCFNFVKLVQQDLYKLTGKRVEVMVFGDGAFKCPRSEIYELADPVVSPGYTDGLIGSPTELKLKFYIDTMKHKGMSDKEIEAEVRKLISAKMPNTSDMGTTPRCYVDLIGSMADLACGSGDKGTPLILLQGYFDDYSR